MDIFHIRLAQYYFSIFILYPKIHLYISVLVDRRYIMCERIFQKLRKFLFVNCFEKNKYLNLVEQKILNVIELLKKPQHVSIFGE